MSLNNRRLWPPRQALHLSVPAASVLFGVIIAIIFVVKGNVGMAIAAFLIMTGYAVVMLSGSRRFEPIAMLRGETVDERRRRIDQRASAATLKIVALVLVGGGIADMIRGHQGLFTWLCSLTGFTYIVATFYYTRRG